MDSHSLALVPEWYLISSEWLLKWKCFVTNHVSSKNTQQFKNSVRMSPNHKIGVLPPGFISNHNLISVRLPDTPKEKLVINQDYKSLRKEIWDKFY